jgi:LmbE family N-acetylglucosaminyl deacetylase
VPYTVVSFHAHPDDEALLTGGTLARAVAEGHRVVLVVATAGEAGLAAPPFGTRSALGARRQSELARSASALGCQRVEVLPYADSGMDGRAGGEQAFARADPEEAARRLAALLDEEAADVLTGYDPAGGYGHPDHVAVHRVAVRAAELAGTPVVLEATVDRDALRGALRHLHRLPGIPADFHPDRFEHAYVERGRLSHVVDVRRFARQKRAAMAAHLSQATTSESGRRTLELFLRLPMPVFRRVFGREWFVERGQPAGGRLDDIFATLRGGSGQPG